MKPFSILSITVLLAAISGVSLVAQPMIPRNAEGAQPRPHEKRRREAMRPYLMTGREVANPYFLNSAAIIESPTGSLAQNESSIAVNPLRPNVLLASAVDYRPGAWAYISSDAGATWRNVSLGDVRTGWGTGNDPSVAFDHLGNGYVMYGAFVSGSSDSSQNGNSGIYISKTTDDGATWRRHLVVIEHTAPNSSDSTFEDKYYIEIDRGEDSPHRGWIYTPWKRVSDRDSATQIMFARSTDGGLTWGQPVAISPRKPGTSVDTTYGQSFPLAACAPDGSVHVVWNDGPIRSIGYARSTDGGATFSAPRLIVPGYTPLGAAKRVGGITYHVLKGTFRCEIYPTMMADNSVSTRRGWLYLAWFAGGSPDVYFSRSTDNGDTWSAPNIIHSDTTNDQFWPWLSVDPTNGDIAVMFSDSRNDPENILIDQYVAYSSDGGDTWIDRRATDFMSDFRKNYFVEGIFAGDYSGNAFFDGHIYPSFLDTRTDDRRLDNDVYVASVHVRQPYPVDSFVVVPNPDNLGALALRWVPPSDLRSIFGVPLTGHQILVRRDDSLRFGMSITSRGLVEQGLEHGRLYTYEVAVATDADTSIWRSVSARPGGALEPAAPEILAHRWSGDTIELDIRVPALRADGSVPLANLAGLRLLRDSRVIREVTLAASDTGRIVTVVDVPIQRGYYRYAVTAMDAVQHESGVSADLIAYVGSLDPYTLDFDGPMPQLLLVGTWARTSELAFSPPSSLTDSPEGDYGPSRNAAVGLYPVLAGSVPALDFMHIAIVDPSDTAIVELRINSDTAWRRVAAFSWQHDPRWTDSAASPADWRAERFQIADVAATDTLWYRLRLRAGIARNADGWYLDDIRIGMPAGFDAVSGLGTLRARSRPNPFRSSAMIEFSLPRRGQVTGRLVDPLGREVASEDLGDRESGWSSWMVDGRELAAGAYYYEIAGPGGRAVGTIVRLP